MANTIREIEDHSAFNIQDRPYNIYNIYNTKYEYYLYYSEEKDNQNNLKTLNSLLDKSPYC